jgi:5-formyltetrahydrofolate cyclo-ligase
MIAVTVDATSTGKMALRRRLRQTRRNRLPDRDREAEATALADCVMALVEEHTGGRACRVAAFESLPTEPPTHLLVQRLASAGHEVVVPVTLPDRDLDWRVAGTSTPLGRNAIHDSEVVLVPGLAADVHGNRLGQGGGSYDRALTRRRPDALLVVLLNDGELLSTGKIPTEEHDVRVHVAVTPSGGLVPLESA